MATNLRFEVWISDTGEASHWKLARRWPDGCPAIYHFDANSGGGAEQLADRINAAIAQAKQLALGNAAVCVEEWDTGRNVYLSTIFEERKG
jgi:hypothetical protein